MEETITLAGGCFWCTEAVFKKIKGISNVISGYANSKVPNPKYEQVCAGVTGAAEAIQIVFDTKEISLEKILEIFFAAHDPTTINQQGSDVGTQYRSGIYCSNDTQKILAEKIKPRGAVTEIKKLENFFPAEEHHQDFYIRNKTYPYCRLIIEPKIRKLIQEFKKEMR